MRKNLMIRSTNFKVEVGNIEKNKEVIKDIVRKAFKDGVNVLSFPELSLTGASLYDAYLDLVENAEKALLELKEFSKDYEIIFSVGLPISYKNSIYNAVALIYNGDILDITFKKNLTNLEKGVFSVIDKDDVALALFDKFYEVNNSLVLLKDLSIAVVIGSDEMMKIPRSLEVMSNSDKHTDIVLNPSAEAKFALNESEILDRIKFLSKDVSYVYTSTGFGESTTDYVYNGLNVIADDGKIIAKSINKKSDYIARYYLNMSEHEHRGYKNIRKVESFPYLPDYEDKDKYVKDVLDIGAIGLLTRMNHIGIKDVFLGVSGGLDSTMAILFIVHAFRKENLDLAGIHCYTMPAFGTSHRTKTNAFKLCEALGLTLNEIDISESVKVHLRDIGHDGITQDTAYENAQARERTQILFDLANMNNGIVIGTGDLSENMQGFATFNGDQMSNYSLNASLTKTEIRYIVDAIAESTENEKLKLVLLDILDTPISPELISEEKGEISQKTEDIIGPYELIDFFIYEHLSYHLSAEEILIDALSAFCDKYDEQTIKKWLISYFKRFQASQFKRSTSVDGPNITGRSFSPRAGFKIPSDMNSASYLEGLDEK